MNRRAEISQKIVQVIERFPKIHKFLTSGDTGCHPQHLVDTIAATLEIRENILIGIGAGLKAELDQALREKDELAAALEELVNYTAGLYASGGESIAAVVKARKIIAEARGEE
jgi:hypothetical protein